MKSLRIENKKQPRIGDVLLIQETYQDISVKLAKSGILEKVQEMQTLQKQ